MILTIGFTFALGVLFPVFMDSFKESREKTGKFGIDRSNVLVVVLDLFGFIVNVKNFSLRYK